MHAAVSDMESGALYQKGGIMEIDSPHYMVLEFSPWLSSWWEKHAEEGKKNGL